LGKHSLQGQGILFLKRIYSSRYYFVFFIPPLLKQVTVCYSLGSFKCFEKIKIRKEGKEEIQSIPLGIKRY
jgi:hypothetical protein